MKSYKAAERAAREIMAKWSDPKSAYFIIVPPLNDSSHLFELLRNTESHGLQKRETFAVAYCPNSSYSDTDTFVDKVCKEWKVDLDSNQKDSIFSVRLQIAIEIVKAGGQRPVLLLPGFDKTVTRLPEELGYCLQELYDQAGLLIVAEIPIEWTKLVERLRNSLAKPTMLDSEFGQDFEPKLLWGYAQDEISTLINDYGLESKHSEPIWKLTGGFTRLVNIAASEKWGDYDANTLLTKSGNRLVNACATMLKCLTQEHKNTIARFWLGTSNEQDTKALTEHEWSGVLLNNGRLRASLLGIACAQEYICWNEDAALNHLSGLLERGLYGLAADQGKAFLGKHNSPLVSDCVLIAEIQSAIYSGLGEWAHTLKLIRSAEDKAAGGDSIILSRQVRELRKCRDFVQKMKVCQDRSAGQAPDIVRHFCELGDILPVLQLMAVRLQTATRIQDPQLRVLCLLSLPESLVQLYCARVLNIRHWQAPSFDEALLEQIRALPRRKEFEWPRPEEPLGFGSLLTLAEVLMSTKPPELRLTPQSDGLATLQNIVTVQSH